MTVLIWSASCANCCCNAVLLFAMRGTLTEFLFQP